MIYMAFERGGPKLSNTTTRALAQRTAVQQRQLRANGYHAAQYFLRAKNLN